MEIEIDTDILKNDSKYMSDYLRNIRADMDRMNNAVQALNTMWKGESNKAFNAQYTSDYERMLEVCDIINRLIECINFAADKYNECEDGVKNIVNSINI